MKRKRFVETQKLQKLLKNSKLDAYDAWVARSFSPQNLKGKLGNRFEFLE